MKGYTPVISLQPPFSSPYGLNPSPTADPYAALGMPIATNYAVGSTPTTTPTYGTTGDWMNYQSPSTPTYPTTTTYPSTPNYNTNTSTTTTDASTVLAPNISNWQTVAPNYTNVSAPNTETNVNLTDASKVYAPVTVYDEKTHSLKTQIVLVDARQYYNQTNNTTTTPTTPTPEIKIPEIKIPEIKIPEIKLPEYPPVQQQQQQQQQTEKKGGIGDWLLPLGLGAAALFILPNLFKGDKKEETTVAKASAAAEATAEAEATTETTETHETTEAPTPTKKEEVSVGFTGYGDPKFKNSATGKIISIDKPGDYQLIKDKNSELKVHMNKIGKDVYMDTINYRINGSAIKADSKGQVTVDGQTVSIGETVKIKHGGTVSVVKDTEKSTTGNETTARIIIKAPNESGGGYENMTIRVRKRKTEGNVYYEFDHNKRFNSADENVNSGRLKEWYAPVSGSTDDTDTLPKTSPEKNTDKNKEEIKLDPNPRRLYGDDPDLNEIA